MTRERVVGITGRSDERDRAISDDDLSGPTTAPPCQPAEALLRRAEAAGVELRPEGGRLRYRGSRSVMDEFLPELRSCRDELLKVLEAERRRELFEERAAIMEYDGGLPRDEAERLAREEVDGRREP